VVVEAFEAWVRARAESDIERTAALEAARAAAAAAQKTAEMQAKKVGFVAPGKSPGESWERDIMTTLKCTEMKTELQGFCNRQYILVVFRYVG
jgi:hypothetical protein